MHFYDQSDKLSNATCQKQYKASIEGCMSKKSKTSFTAFISISKSIKFYNSYHFLNRFGNVAKHDIYFIVVVLAMLLHFLVLHKITTMKIIIIIIIIIIITIIIIIITIIIIIISKKKIYQS